jgi:hypothetical protein
LFGSFPVFCQQVDELVKQSLAYFERSDFQRFEEIYQRIYIAYLKENLPLYEAAAEATEKGNNELAFECLNELIDEGCFLDEIADDETFKTLYKEEGWNVLLRKISVIKEGYHEELRRELRRIQDKDQGIRILYLRIKGDSLGTAVHDYMKTVVDPDCAERVCRILDEYGWLGEEVLGSEANEALFLGIQHADDSKIQEKYIPMLREAVKEGKADGWQLAFLTDRILMNQGKKQIYGTQKVISTIPGRSYIIPLEDPERVDELRQEVGLPSLADDLEEEGMHWDPEEYRRNLPEIERMYKERSDSLK